ncbi:MAG: hypothetical protein HZA35_02900 [Parcubacteria group bacterium]|nr:hypothetical protein [Parcubacteria group bacterium]
MLLVEWFGILFAIVWIAWVVREYLYVYKLALVFWVQYYAVTTFARKRCVYDESVLGARVLIYVEDGVVLRDLELLPQCIEEIYEDFNLFVVFFKLEEFLSDKDPHDVTAVFYKENTYNILDRLCHMNTRGFYLPALRKMSLRTNAILCDLDGMLGKTVRHEFFHYLVHAFFVKGALTYEQEEGCARVFEEWRSMAK